MKCQLDTDGFPQRFGAGGGGGGGRQNPPPVQTHWWRGNAKLSRGHFCQKGKVEGVT